MKWIQVNINILDLEIICVNCYDFHFADYPWDKIRGIFSGDYKN